MEALLTGQLLPHYTAGQPVAQNHCPILCEQLARVAGSYT